MGQKPRTKNDNMSTSYLQVLLISYGKMQCLKRIEESLHVFWRFACKQLLAIVGVLEDANKGTEHLKVGSVHGFRYEHETDDLDL